MPTTPAPDTLDQRVHDHREQLTVLMADTGRCEDISSGIGDDMAEDAILGILGP
ncbi:MAG: hypothetical protein ACRDRS_12190 [Pseudonocardiaceae bacterium]